jgi:excisionase family DNA binding protein
VGSKVGSPKLDFRALAGGNGSGQTRFPKDFRFRKKIFGSSRIMDKPSPRHRLETRVNRFTPLLSGLELCRRLAISPRRLRDWEKRVPLPYRVLGRAHRYPQASVEDALHAHRYGPALPPCTDRSELRQRIKADEVCRYLACSRKTLERRIIDGAIPCYRHGQSYRFVLDEIEHALTIPRVRSSPTIPVLVSSYKSSNNPVPYAELSPRDIDLGALL